MLVLAEVSIFTVVFGAFVVEWSRNPSFATSAAQAHVTLGILNTVVLLTSSLTAAEVVARVGDRHGARNPIRPLLATAALGVVFILVKIYEYTSLVREGLTPLTDSFGMYYYVLTGLHLTHVLLGLGALAIAHRALVRADGHRDRTLITTRSAMIYWHMVDVLWLFLFPLVYLAAR